VDVGVCGELGRPGAPCCLMLGGDEAAVRSLRPVLDALLPSHAYLHCGPTGAGHFVNTIHDGIERRLIAAYAEGFRMIRAADTGWTDRDPGHTFDLPAIVDVWRRGAPVASAVMERAARDQAAAHEAGCVVPEMHR